MDINNYIAKLNDLSNNMDVYIRDIVLKNKGELLGSIKLRLYNRGVDAKGNSLGVYSARTKILKKKKNQRTTHVTLRDSGDWYGSMFIDFKEGSIFVDATDWKTGLLEDVYGQEILSLSDSETALFVDSSLEPELEKLVNLDNLNLGYI